MVKKNEANGSSTKGVFDERGDRDDRHLKK